jgi:hypothetical protein
VRNSPLDGWGNMAKSSDGSGTVIIKKYANRRLYNTETSSYITLEHLAAMTREGRDFKVIDAKSEEDITHNVLTQIIMEEESRGNGRIICYDPKNGKTHTAVRNLVFPNGICTAQDGQSI